MIKTSNKKRLETLKKGDKIYIEYGSEISKAKVFGNDPNNRTILIRLCWDSGGKQIRNYDAYNFEHFDLLNN
jgi:hypothetical protein